MANRRKNNRRDTSSSWFRQMAGATIVLFVVQVLLAGVGIGLGYFRVLDWFQSTILTVLAMCLTSLLGITLQISPGFERSTTELSEKLKEKVAEKLEPIRVKVGTLTEVTEQILPGIERHTTELSDRLQKEVAKKLEPLCKDASTLIEVTNNNALKYLKKIIEYHNLIAKGGQLGDTPNLLAEYLIKHHMVYYSKVLIEFVGAEKIQLPSDPRKDAVIRTLERAEKGSTIRAITTPDDHWFGRDQTKDDAISAKNGSSEYLTKNLEAKARGAAIKRIYVVDNEKDIIQIKNGHIWREQLKKEIQLAWVLTSESRSAIQREVAERMISVDTFENLFICEFPNSSGVLTYSTTKWKHDGYLVLAKDDINKYKSVFEAIWKNSEKINTNMQER